MNQAQLDFLNKATAAATAAKCPFPDMMACEAALESGWGNSVIAAKGCNMFGCKQHAHPIFDTLNLPTREYLGGGWTVVMAPWVEYPDWAACFADRLSTLQRLAPSYPHYAAALNAKDPATYINEVSKTWSTDPNRAAHVLAIYNEYQAALAASPASSASSASSAS